MGLRALMRPRTEERSQLSFNQYLDLIQPWLPYFTQNPNREREEGGKTAEAMAKKAVTGNAIAFTAAAARLQVFSEVEFKWQDLKTRELFGSGALAPLEAPWVGGSSGDLLARMEQDATCAGNSFWYDAGSLVRSDTVNLARLEPAKMTILGEQLRLPGGAKLGWAKAGYLYAEGEEDDAEFLDLSEVAHYAPLPDPWAQFRGMSWLTPVLREIDADNALTTFKEAHIENAATPNLVVTFDPSVTPEKFKQLTEVIKRKMTGPTNAGKTLALAGGADVKVVGSNLEQLAFKAVQGAGETRIAAASRVPITILNLSEGLSGSSLNQGNYAMARRSWADTGLRPMWRGAASALATIVPAPPGARLWYDPASVSFLQEDVKDEAEIRQSHASTIRTLVEAGYDPKTAVAAATHGDFAGLTHTGKLSVQLQEPGTPVADPVRSMLALSMERAAAPEARPHDTHIHLPESLAMEVRADDELRNAVRVLAERAITAEDLAVLAASLPAPQVTVAAPNVTVEAAVIPAPQVTVEVAAPVVNMASQPVQLTLLQPEHDTTKAVKLKIGDKTVTGTITES